MHDLNQLAHPLGALGERPLADREEEARAALTEALEFYERTGNVVMVERTRELLAGGDGHR